MADAHSPYKDAAGNPAYGAPAYGPVDAKYRYSSPHTPQSPPQGMYAGEQTPTHEMESQVRHEMPTQKERAPVELPGQNVL